MLVVGDLVTDVVAVAAGPLAEGTDTAASITLTGGGAAANTAAWLAYAQLPVTLVAAVGDDPAGAQRVAELESAGVRCAVSRHPGPSGTVVVIADGAERTMLCDRGANAHLSTGDIDAGLPGAGHLHLSGYPLFDERTRPAGRYALAAARTAGLTVSVDAASARPLRQAGPASFLEWVRGVDLLFANADEARVLVGDVAPDELARRLAGHVATVIVKLGADGAVWADSGSRAGVVRRSAV
ncbi:MAG: carbohydrate kinase family protein, partial [Micromonosporaceae bacterium]